MVDIKEILFHFEVHSVEGIRSCLENGFDPNQLYEGKPIVYALINMYYRSKNFSKCLEVLVEKGLVFEDKFLLAVLLNDAGMLKGLINKEPRGIHNRYNLDSTFTPLYQVSLMHICAEYNHLECAKVLFECGADINQKAGEDEHGFGGQTPIFHTVNQDNNKSIEMMLFLLQNNADLDITVKGLIWGKGYEWETFIPSVNPLSYAMMGLLRQFQRNEKEIYDVVDLLMKSKYNIDYKPTNIPNKYLG